MSVHFNYLLKLVNSKPLKPKVFSHGDGGYVPQPTTEQSAFIEPGVPHGKEGNSSPRSSEGADDPAASEYNF